MARGHSNKTVGQAGEFAVCAELGRRNLIATPFSGNVPHYDILISDENLNTIPIQVKTILGHSTFRTGTIDNWAEVKFDRKTQIQMLKAPLKIAHPTLIMVHVWLAPELSTERDRFFILTKADLQSIQIQSYERFLNRLGGHRPRNPESKVSAIGINELVPFENKWSLITGRLQLTAASGD